MAFWRPFDTSDNEADNIEPMQPEFINKDLHVQTRRVILNIYSCLKAENQTYSDNQIIARISELTKISHATVYRLIKTGDVVDHSTKRKRVGQKLRKLDIGTRENIRRIVYDFYKQNKVPTLEMIQEQLKIACPDYDYKSLDSLRLVLLECGFKYKKINKRFVIMESARLVKQRQDYLHKIKEYRETRRDIVYLDETWFDTHDVVQYGWVDNSEKCNLTAPCSRGKRIIILHAGTETGFVPNALLLSAKNIKNSSADYHEDMTGELFEKWAQQQLFPNINPNSVIVMDNASYHSRILPDTKIPNTGTKKAEIIKFMKCKGMEIPANSTKKILLQMIKQQNFKNEYVIDKFFETHGHIILRLPPYYCVFNPIEMIWAAIKNKLRKVNQSPQLSECVVENIRTVVKQLDETDIWKNCVSHVKEKENEYCILPPIAPIIIKPNDGSSSEDLSDSDE